MYSIYILVFAGLMGAFLYGIEAFILKYTLNISKISGSAYALYSALIHFVIGIIIIGINNIDIFINIHTILVFISAGGLLGLTYYGYYYLMNKYSATNILQLASLESVSTPIAGIIILKESFSISSLFGIILIIFGILILSIDRGVLKNIKQTVLPMIGIIFLWSIDDLLLKTGLENTGFLIGYFWSRLGIVIILSLKTSQVSNLISISEEHSLDEHILYIFASCCSSVAIYLTLFTYNSLPISIANPIVSTYPIMLIGIVTIFRKLKIYDIEPGTNLLRKLLSAIIFLIGIFILTVTVTV